MKTQPDRTLPIRANVSLKLLPWICALFLATTARADPADPTVANAPGRQSPRSRIIQYRGPMPLLQRELWGQSVELRFELYRSPEGGSPFWKEIRAVAVSTNGWVSVDLGEVKRLPDEAFNTPFRFLAIWHGKVDFSPRKQIASLAYVAASLYQDILGQARRIEGKLPSGESKGDRLALGPLVDCGEFRIEQRPRPATNWLMALEEAEKSGARLPTFEEWYGAYDGTARSALENMTGHYEWVIPWVYEPTIHARFHELYRGKPVACYYEELNPLNSYPFRLVTPKP